jgi:septum formation protein
MSRIVLASGSASRAALLAQAGVACVRDASDVDEDAVKQALQAQPTGEIAMALAVAKAERVAARHPGALVIGGDQMLDCEGRRFDKPADRDAARAQLMALRGRRHTLPTAAVVMRDGTVLWRALEMPALAMRNFSEAFLDAYLAEVGDAVTKSVGAYQLEGRGIQLFDSVEGTFFTILGLPMVPLLGFLRSEGVLPT